MVNSCAAPHLDASGVCICLCAIVSSASKNESTWFLKISQDQMLLQTKPIQFLDFWGGIWKGNVVHMYN